jgi:holo-[acyl-carrier protein] synthase|tara:strand:+ start:367 stop:762 length:396 start_codon:yes stop_codon:yes gene_type:complete
VIISNGIDITDIRRIKKTIDKYNFRFKKKCFHPGEISKSERRLKSVESYAKRYAAKEACSKALGTGLARGVYWKDIEVTNNKYGKPKIKLHNRALKFLKELLKSKDYSIEVSLSDEKNYAIANVIIYGKEK